MTTFYALIKLLGLWLHESGVLGASPDGIVVQPPSLPQVHFQTTEAELLHPDIIEVKCPYSMREATVVQGALGDARTFLGIVTLNPAVTVAVILFAYSF